MVRPRNLFRTSRRLAGFTLIEVLIVILVIAILASAIIVHTTSAVADSKVSSLRMNVRILRDQIARYKWDHKEGLPNGINNLEQLTSATDTAGTVGPAGPSYPFGPYLQKMPANPFTDSPKVRLDTGAAGTLPSASGANDAGWIYRASTGEIWADDPQQISF